MGNQAVADQAGTVTSESALEIITGECRDLLEVVQAKGYLDPGLTHEQKNQIVRDHFGNDFSGYGIPVEEWLPEITAERRDEIVNEILAKPEYTD